MRIHLSWPLRALLLLLPIGCGGNDGGPADVPIIVLSESTLSLTEGTAETLTVVLDAAPTAPLSVVLGSGGRVALLPSTLEFTPADFSTPKSIVVTPLEDADLLASVDTITVAATDLGTIKVPVTIAEDDSQAVLLDSTEVTVTEGDSVTVKVRLAFQPAGTVTVNITTLDSAVARPTFASVGFTPADYAAYKSLKVLAVQDSGVSADSAVVRFQAAGIGTTDLRTHVIDDDHQALVLNRLFFLMNEGAIDSFTVRLAYRPAGDLTVLMAASQDPKVFPFPTELHFTTNDWDLAQTVGVAAEHDDDLVDARDTIFFLPVDPGASGGNVSIELLDVDTQAVQVDSSGVTMAEGDSVSVGVRLVRQPPGTTNVLVTALDTATATVNTSFLAFTPGDYATPKAVWVKGVHDVDLATGNTSVRFSGADFASLDLPVAVTDLDGQAIQSSASALTVTEGSTGQLGVRLAQQPAGDYVVTATSSDPLAATVQAPTTLTFTTVNWATYQQVTIAGVQDPDLAAGSATIYLGGVGVPQKAVGVTITDDDVQAFVTSVDTIYVTEGDSTDVTVTLAFQPPGSVSAALTIDGLVATVDPATLASFTPGNYMLGFTIRLHGAEDANTTTDQTQLFITAPGVATRNVVVIVADND